MRLPWSFGVGLTLVAAASTTGFAELDLFEVKPRTVAACDALVRDYPAELEAYRCYEVQALLFGRQQESLEHLATLIQTSPTPGLARLYWGILARDNDAERAESALRLALDELDDGVSPSGEVVARIALFFLLSCDGRLGESERTLEPAIVLADQIGDPQLRAQVAHHLGIAASKREDFVAAELHYRAVLTLTADEAPRHRYVRALALMSLADLGSRAQAWNQIQPLLESALALHRKNADLFNEAYVRYRLAMMALDGGDVGKRLLLLDDLLRFATGAGNRTVVANMHAALAEIDALPLAARREHAIAAVQIFHAAGRYAEESRALRARAQLEARSGPAGRSLAEQLLSAAERGARRIADNEELVGALLSRAQLRIEAGARRAGLTDWMDALALIERIRDLQRDESVRATFMGGWAFTYYQLIDALLPVDRPAEPDAIVQAFAVSERLRARVLLDRLDATGATAQIAATAPQRLARDAILVRINRAQRRLLSSELDDDERERLLAEVKQLEGEERRLTLELAQLHPGFARSHASTPIELSELQRALQPHQAWLSFLTGRDAAIGSRVMAITQDRAEAFPLPATAALQSAVDQYVGLLARHDDLPARAATGLYRDLLERPLDALPTGITEIMIAADGPLHRMPWDTLRAAATDPPLGARFELSIAPSASSWVWWQHQPEAERRGAALTLADPEWVTSDVPGTTWRASQAWLTPLQLGRLPYARREARAMAREAGRGSVLRVGRDASEAFLESSPLAHFGVLHFAAHAVSDDSHPERSAVVLAPGDSAHDGLLQPREIVALDLPPGLVVLSACSSAAGPIVHGEGVLGLAQAFLQAGSRAVVGGLWPVRDEAAAQLMQDFAKHLAAGLSVTAALARAKRDRLDAGSPAADWAGFIVIGDGGFAPLQSRPSTWPVWGGALLLAGLLAVGLHRTLWRAER